MAKAIDMAKEGDQAMIKLVLGDMLKEVRGETKDTGNSGAINVNISLMKEDASETVIIEQTKDTE